MHGVKFCIESSFFLYSADLNYPDKTNKTWTFQTRFSQIGVKFDKMWRQQKLLKISPETIWCHFFCKILYKNCTPKMSHFGFFQIIKLIDFKNYITGSLFTQLNKVSEGLNLQKPVSEKKISLDSQKMWFLQNKTQNLCLKINLKQFAHVFGGLTWPIFRVKFLLRVLEKKYHHINSKQLLFSSLFVLS